MEYPKIETLFDRDETTKKVLEGHIRLPEFGLVNKWLVTEKIDGTNIRVILEPEKEMDIEGVILHRGVGVKLGGRTDAAQMPVNLLGHLLSTFPAEKVAAAFDPGTHAILFGEGYGPKIQKGGGSYRNTPSFRLFDVVVFGGEGRPWWLNWPDVEDVAKKLGIETVPVLGIMDLEYAIRFGRGTPSLVAERESLSTTTREAEGIVARTDPLLFDRRGKRVIWKLKVGDF